MIDPRDLPNMKENPHVAVMNIKYTLRCRECGHQYGVVLTSEGKLPTHWDFCMVCASRRKQATKEYFDALSKGGEPTKPDYVKDFHDEHQRD